MIRFVDSISPEEYLELRRKVGWNVFPIEEARNGIDHAYMIQCVRDDERAIGVARLLWDGGYVAFLSDVIVDPEYQGQGIGKQLVKNCIDRIKSDMKIGYRVNLCLLAAKGKEPFYAKLGFDERPNERFGAGMNQWLTLDE